LDAEIEAVSVVEAVLSAGEAFDGSGGELAHDGFPSFGQVSLELRDVHESSHVRRWSFAGLNS
jgi:hypothetical protein